MRASNCHLMKILKEEKGGNVNQTMFKEIIAQNVSESKSSSIEIRVNPPLNTQQQNCRTLRIRIIKKLAEIKDGLPTEERKSLS